MGPIIAKNLERLGYVEVKKTIPLARIAREVSEKTKQKITRQRVATILNSVRVEMKTVDHLAAGLGVTRDELLRED